MKSLHGKQVGFTIVEVLIVIFVIGILALIVNVQYTGIQARGRDTERKSDIRALQSKVAEHFALNGYYPVALAAITGLPTDACSAPSVAGSCTTPNYEYKAFRVGTAVDVSSTADCDNSANKCVAYIIYTSAGSGAMETIANPYAVSSN